MNGIIASKVNKAGIWTEKIKIDEFFAVHNKKTHHLYNSLFYKQLNQMFEEDIVSFDNGSRNTENMMFRVI